MDYQPPSGEGFGGPSAPSAPCPLHPEQAAQSICARCGNFMCDACTEHGTYEACPTCRQLTGDVPGFVWTRNDYSLDGILSFAWERFKREWVMLSLAALLYFVVVVGASFVAQILQTVGMAIHPVAGGALGLAGSTVQYIVQGVLAGGMAVVIYDVMKGRQVDLGRMFGQFRNIGTYAVATLLMVAILLAVMLVIGIPAGIGYAINEEEGLAIGFGIGVVIALFPMIWVLLPWMFLEMEIALGGEQSGVQAVSSAFKLASGHRLWMLLFGFVAWALTFVGVLACCIGMLPAFALATMLKTGLFLALRNGSGLGPLRGDV